MEKEKMYLMSCHLAGRMYHDADEVWNKLKVGTKLRLVRDVDNRYDPKAIAVVYDSIEEDKTFSWGIFLVVIILLFLFFLIWVGHTFLSVVFVK